MSNSKLSNEIALRIALAARALPDTDAARLLKVLDSAIGLPPNIVNLSKLSLKILKSAADSELSDIDNDSLKAALTILKGDDDGLIIESTPVPQSYTEGEMPGSIRVAFASNKGEELDGHFGSCLRFLIYQMDENEIRLIDTRDTAGISDEGDKNANRAAVIADCNVLYVVSIGGPAAAKVVKAGIHPIKQPAGGNAREKLAELQSVLAGTPPPWLAKAMGHDEQQRVRFERSAEEA
ncbi:MAG: NifB/NifX family molybdenum-iron cluster-binding protein [Granulosicoccaceae bacterium]|jgi:nitrogen fixation protein NifX